MTTGRSSRFLVGIGALLCGLLAARAAPAENTINSRTAVLRTNSSRLDFKEACSLM